ncbi:hypothetical protein BDV06DRAFT_124743 [Aspergillus oleicola]
MERARWAIATTIDTGIVSKTGEPGLPRVPNDEMMRDRAKMQPCPHSAWIKTRGMQGRASYHAALATSTGITFMASAGQIGWKVRVPLCRRQGLPTYNRGYICATYCRKGGVHGTVRGSLCHVGSACTRADENGLSV